MSSDDATIRSLPRVTRLLDRARAAGYEVLQSGRGYGLDGARLLADELVASGVLPPGVPVHAVDANAAWARPGDVVLTVGAGDVDRAGPMLLEALA